MKVYRFIIISVLIAVVAAEGFLFGFTMDDSFVTYRFVQNIVDGNGAVYNSGDTPGILSNHLWMLLHVPFVWIGIPVEIASKCLGLLSTAMMAVFFFILVKRNMTKNAKYLAFLMTLVLLTNLSVLFFSVSGQEIIFFTMMLTAFLLLMDLKFWIAADLLFCVLVMIRPEAGLLLIPYTVKVFSEKRFTLPAFYILLPLYISLGLFLYWLGLFSNPFPETFLTLLFNDVNTRAEVLANTLAFISGFVHWSLKSLGLGILFVFALTGLVKSFKKNISIFIAVIILFGLIWFEGDEPRVFEQPFLIAFIPVLFLAAFGLDHLFKQIEVAKTRAWIMGTLFLYLVLFNLGLTGFTVYRLHTGDWTNTAVVTETHREAGKFLKAYGNPWDVLVTDEVGVLGYYSDLKIIPPDGLIQSQFRAKANLNNENPVADKFISEEPKFVVLSVDENNKEQMMSSQQKVLYSKMMDEGGYYLLKEVKLSEREKWLIYEKSDQFSFSPDLHNDTNYKP